MRRFLLPESGDFYKANLHCHTTYSDGKFTPEEVKKIYKDHGYSIVAYTDHDIMIDHNDLADDDFLPLRGYEMEITEPSNGRENKFLKTCHLCLIALESDNFRQVCYHRSKYVFKGALEHLDEVKFYEDEPDFERYYTPERINEVIKIARDKGFFVTYNHPSWSLESYPEYIKYEGMNALEIYNSTEVHGFGDYNPRVYDDILRAGRRIYCIAADDNHNGGVPGRKSDTAFKGFTMIKADKLQYESITTALKDGHFYASTGPEIYSLYIEKDENGLRVHIECSDAECIMLHTGIRKAGAAWAPNGEALTKASFPIDPDCNYIRLSVRDASGKVANTNAYFVDEFFEN